MGQALFLGLNGHLGPQGVSVCGPIGFLKERGKGIVLVPQDLPPMRTIRLHQPHPLNGIILQPLDFMFLPRIPMSAKDFAIFLCLHIGIHVPIMGRHIFTHFLDETGNDPRLHYVKETFSGTSCNRIVLVAERDSSWRLRRPLGFSPSSGTALAASISE